jgi:hypothetical protein
MLSGRRGIRGPGWPVTAVLALAPVIGVVFDRAPLVNQAGWLDAWFYAGYGWALPHGLTVFENTYFGVRFPPVLLITASTGLFGAIGGYVVLRYLILVGTGVALYAGVRQFASRRAAAGAVVLLALDVFYLRLVLWDYVTFVMIPASLAGVALWPRDPARRGLRAAAASGALLAAAAFSNPLALAVVPPLLAVELLAALRRRAGEPVRFVQRVGIAFLGGVAVFAFGAIVYWLVAGFSPYDLLRPTVNFLRNDNEIAAGYVLPVSKWIFNEPEIYAPPVLLAAVPLVMGRRILGTGTAARLAQFSIIFVLELFAYRFTATTSLVETWWAYGITAIPMAFAGALLLDGVDRLPRQRLLAVAAVAGVVALVGLTVRLDGMHAVNAYRQLRTHHWLELLLVIVALAGVVAWRWLGRAGGAIAVTVLLAVVTVLSLTPADYLGIARTGQFSAGALDELRGYALSYTIVRDIADQDTPASRTLVWYPSPTGLLSTIWSTLPLVGGSLNAYDQTTPLSQLTDYERGRLAYPTTARVLVVSQDPADLERARSTLRRAGYRFAALGAGTWVDGRVHHQLLRLRSPAPGDTLRAVRMASAAILEAWRRKNAQQLCWLSVPTLNVSFQAQSGSCAKGLAAPLDATGGPGGGVGAINVNGDTATVTIAGTRRRMVLERVQSEWLEAAGDVPWVR